MLGFKVIYFSLKCDCLYRDSPRCRRCEVGCVWPCCSVCCMRMGLECLHENRGTVGLEGTSGIMGSPCPAPAGAGSPRAGCTESIQAGDPTASLGSLPPCSVTLNGGKFFLIFRRNFLCCSLCLLPLVLSLGTT